MNVGGQVMKKALMILASVALGASMASAADVVSKNVVGFQTVTVLSNIYTAVGWQFAVVNGATNVSISSITNYPGVDTGTSTGTADNMRRWNGTTGKWKDYFRGSTGWRNAVGGALTTDVIPIGEMVMFYKKTEDSVLTQAGEVIVPDVIIAVESNQYTAICNPYPVPIAVSSITNYAGVDTGTSTGTADNMRRWNGTTGKWKDYFRGSTGWRNAVGGALATDVIAGGEGVMFYKKTEKSEITFTSPL
jgi:hypothetical protein